MPAGTNDDVNEFPNQFQDTSDSDSSSDIQIRNGKDSNEGNIGGPLGHLKRARQAAFAKSAAKSVLTERQRKLIKDVSKDPLQTYRKTEEALTRWRQRKKELE